MNTAILHGEYVVLPTRLVPSMLADAASMVADSATLTVQSYQQAMLMLVRWYEAGQLAGRGAPATPPGGGAPAPVATAPAAFAPGTPLAAEASEAPTTSTAPAEVVTTPSATTAHVPSTANEVAPADHERETATAAVSETQPDVASPPTTAVPATSPQRSAARPFLPTSAPPLEAPSPSDALGHAARLAITRRYGADATDPGA